jgi:flagellar protein FliO/FliZ
MSPKGRHFIALKAFALAATTSMAADATYLAGSAGAPASPVHADSGMGSMTLVGAFLLAAAGGWLLLRGRKISLPGRAARRLEIDETRSLGSRQYLVVATYEGKRLLLGVCPGRIDLLTPLDGPAATQKAQ